MRSQQTFEPAHHPTSTRFDQGDFTMHATLHPNDVDGLVQNRMYLAQDRIGDLYATAREVHVGHRDATERSGLVTRTRWSIGRRLASIGHTVTGQQA